MGGAHVPWLSNSCWSACGLEKLKGTIVLKTGKAGENVNGGLKFSFCPSYLPLTHLASAGHKPDSIQKLCSRCYGFVLDLQSLVPWQGWYLGQVLGKTQLKASGSWASSCLLILPRQRVRLSKRSPVSVGRDVTHVTSSVAFSERPPICYWCLRQFPGVLFLLVPEGRPPPGIALSPWKKNYWLG